MNSGHWLHQSAAWIGVVVIVLGTPTEHGVEAEGQKADGAGDQTETALEATTDVDQLAHEAM